jgi:hypothetical protein
LIHTDYKARVSVAKEFLEGLEKIRAALICNGEEEAGPKLGPWEL